MCFVGGGVDVDDSGAPVKYSEEKERAAQAQASQASFWSSFTVPFFSTGDAGDEWSASEEENDAAEEPSGSLLALSPRLSKLHLGWKTCPDDEKSEETERELLSPINLFTATPEAETASAEPSAPQTLTFTEPIEDDEAEPEEDYRTGGYHPMRPNEIVARRYKVERKLGWGVYSTVWLAADSSKKKEALKSSIDGRVAIKVQKSAREYSRAARNEIALLQAIEAESTKAGLRNSRLVRLLQCFEMEGPNGRHTCMVFEPLGHSLLGLIQVDGVVQPRATAHILSQLLEGLGFLHQECRVIHTDIKPENVLLVPGSNPATPSIKIVDFGNACFCSEQVAKAIQTREYRSPEAILGSWPYTCAVDMWSVGAMTFELLTGEILFDANMTRPNSNVSKDEMHLAEISHLLGQIPAHVVARGRYSSKWLKPDGELLCRGALLNQLVQLGGGDDGFAPCDFEPFALEARLSHFVPHKEIADLSRLLRNALIYDPQTRLTAQELSNERWLKNHLLAPEAGSARRPAGGAAAAASSSGASASR